MSFDYYFAGSQSIKVDKLLAKRNANILRSYATEKKNISFWFEQKKNGWLGKLMIDNGAFTFHRKGGSLNIDEYINWLNDNDDYYDYAIALDDIPGKWRSKT